MAELTTTTPSPAMETFTPTVFINLAKDDLSQLGGLKVGDNVRVVLLGTVKSLSQGESDGGFSLETKSARVQGQPESANVFTDLVEDD